MTTPPTDKIAFPIPDTLVEAAAKAEYTVDMTAEESDDFEPFTWDEALTKVQGYYRERAAAGLAAALATGEVRHDWGDHDTAYVGDVKKCRSWRGHPHPGSTAHNRIRSVVTFPDGSQWTSAWTEVAP